MTNNKKQKIDKRLENAEYGVESRYRSNEERNVDGKSLMEARKQRLANSSSDQIIKARLLQLKLKMEEFLKKPVHKEHDFFIEFLKSYIDIVYSKRTHFAQDINIKPVLLSQVLNKHRDPNDEFILRLMIHSEKTYKEVCPFQKETWYQVYFHEKICDTISTEHVWMPEVEKHVKIDNLKINN